ncbi:MAG: acetate--CoA ligase family protein [Desulfurococcaceae archaeon]
MAQGQGDLKSGRYKLLEHEAFRLLEEYGIPYPPYGLAKTPEEAAELASKIGFPVVLKVVSPDISHKTDVGGVILGVSSVEEVVEGFEKIMKNVKSRVQDARVNGILVQKMVPRGVEVIVGGLRDYTFGVAVMFGLGGVFTEVFKDVTFRIWPFTLEEALEMVNEIRSATILKGFRDTPPVDVYSVADILVKLGKLLNEHSEIESADLNPVVVYPDRALVVDARFIVGASKG